MTRRFRKYKKVDFQMLWVTSVLHTTRELTVCALSIPCPENELKKPKSIYILNFFYIWNCRRHQAISRTDQSVWKISFDYCSFFDETYILQCIHQNISIQKYYEWRVRSTIVTTNECAFFFIYVISLYSF